MRTTALIIGGGLGGLFAGAILAKEGVGVTILEKNHIIGGGLQSFRRMGLSFDTGMHVLAGMEEGQSIRRLCEWLGIYDKIRLHHIGPDIIDTLFFGEDGKFYDIGKGREGFVDSLAKYFPDQRQNLENYVSAMYAITDNLDLFHLRPSQGFVQIHTDEALMAADAFIAKYISDPRLRGVVAYMNPLYSGRADETPAYIHAIISVLYIQGPSRFIGGSLHFAKILQEFIEQHGGQVLTGSPVVKINTIDRSITSVETPDGRMWSADWYISDIHPCSLISLLDDPKALPKPFRNRMQEIPNSYSAFTLSIKLKKDSFRYLDHSMYFIDRYDEVWSFGDTSKKWPLGYLMMTPPEEGQGGFHGRAPSCRIPPMEGGMCSDSAGQDGDDVPGIQGLRGGLQYCFSADSQGLLWSEGRGNVRIFQRLPQSAAVPGDGGDQNSQPAAYRAECDFARVLRSASHCYQHL